MLLFIANPVNMYKNSASFYVYTNEIIILHIPTTMAGLDMIVCC